MQKYDVIVIGAGHAGIEAAVAAAKSGCAVLLLTIDIDGIGRLSCNPAVGGVSKGHLVREVDALGGVIGKIADKAAVGYRFLNRSKGMAVWATRAQVDKNLYPKIAREFLENTLNITILQAKVSRLVVKNNKINGVQTNFGQIIPGKTAIICAGTFLKSTIHIGLDNFSGGRLGEGSSDELFENLSGLKITVKHFKTGTCPRLDKRTVDFTKMQEQPPEKDVVPFSFSNEEILKDQLSCYITRTNKKTHKIILKNLKRSPLYTGKIKSRGVRYCPSLEDKIVKFSDKDSHHIFIEPEGRNTVEIYPNGISTSLPFDVQEDFIRTIKGLENAKILRPGYGIEHGVIDSRELYANMESKRIGGLFFAGQVNGTTGYEEAAAQGCVAGINAALKVKNKKPFILKREEAFVGVLVDDLTSKGVDEPYRMFTSRAEFRLSIRETNAAFRLAPLAYKLGLISRGEYDVVLRRQEDVKRRLQALRVSRIFLDGKNVLLYEALKRPGIGYGDLENNTGAGSGELIVKMETEITVKYEGFLNREKIWQTELKNLERIKIPPVDFSRIPSLSREEVEKLTKFKPDTLAAALKISGITPAAVLSIYGFIKRR